MAFKIHKTDIKLKNLEERYKGIDFNLNFVDTDQGIIVYSLTDYDKTNNIYYIKLDLNMQKHWYPREEFTKLIKHAYELELFDKTFKTHLTIPLT